MRETHRKLFNLQGDAIVALREALNAVSATHDEMLALFQEINDLDDERSTTGPPRSCRLTANVLASAFGFVQEVLHRTRRGAGPQREHQDGWNHRQAENHRPRAEGETGAERHGGGEEQGDGGEPDLDRFGTGQIVHHCSHRFVLTAALVYGCSDGCSDTIARQPLSIRA